MYTKLIFLKSVRRTYWCVYVQQAKSRELTAVLLEINFVESLKFTFIYSTCDLIECWLQRSMIFFAVCNVREILITSFTMQTIKNNSTVFFTLRFIESISIYHLITHNHDSLFFFANTKINLIDCCTSVNSVLWVTRGDQLSKIIHKVVRFNGALSRDNMFIWFNDEHMYEKFLQPLICALKWSIHSLRG